MHSASVPSAVQKGNGEAVISRDVALDIATRAHAGQVDKGGRAYIEHPVRVAERVKVYGDEAVVVALLHDVVEDTSVTLKHLYEAGFNDCVLAAVAAITKDPEESYDAYIGRVKQNRLATLVKIADLTDNYSGPNRAGHLRGTPASKGRYLARKMEFTAELMRYAAKQGWYEGGIQ